MVPADYKKLSLESSHWLEREVSMKEVKKKQFGTMMLQNLQDQRVLISNST